MKQSNVLKFEVLSAIVLPLLLLLSACHTDAQGIPSGIIVKPASQNVFSVGATNNGTAVAWCTIPANSINGGVPIVTALNFGCDSVNVSTSGYTNIGAVQTWRIVDQTSANYTNTTTSVPVTATNSFAAGDLILVRHMTDDNYERLALTTAASGTNLTLSAAPAETILPGDLIYRLSCTNAPALSIITAGLMATNTVTGARIVQGQKGLPLHLSLQGAAKASIFNASGYYEEDVQRTVMVLSK